MKEKWKVFVESIRKDKKKGLIVFVVFFGLIGTIIMGLVFGNGKAEEPTVANQVSSIDVPVDTTGINNNTHGDGAYSGGGSHDDDFFKPASNTEIEESNSSQQATSTTNANTTYYKPKNHYNSGGSSSGASSKKTSYVAQKEEPVVEAENTGGRKRTRVPSDGAGNMSGASNKLYKGTIANGNQIVKAGSYVKVRLAEEMVVNGMKIPRNTVVSGLAQINGERMAVVITSVKIGTESRAVNWTVYDEDGNEGVAIPSNILNDIAKDGTKETIEEGNKVEANVPIVGSIKVNLKKKNQEVSFVLRDGHRIYLKEKK